MEVAVIVGGYAPFWAQNGTQRQPGFSPRPQLDRVMRQRIEVYSKGHSIVGQVDTGPRGVIVAAPAIWKVFVGQPIRRLTDWLRRHFDEVRAEHLYPGKETN